MDNKDKEGITLKFIEIAKDTQKFISSDENQAYYLDSMLASSFEEETETILVSLLKDPVYAAKFSEEYLENLLKDKVREMIHTLRQQELPRVLPRKMARRTGEAIFNELDNYAIKQTVYLPIAGISLQLEEEKLEIGNVAFQKMTQERIDEVISHVASAIMALSNTLEYKQGFIKIFTEDLQKVFEDSESPVYAVYHVVAEPIRARERAVEECYQVIDVLRYVLPLFSNLYPMRFSIPLEYIDNNLAETNKFVKREKKVEREPGGFISFGLQGEVGMNTTRQVIILRDSPGFNWNTDRKERFLPLALHPEDIEEMKRAKVFEVSQIIKKGEASQTNFERTILRGIHWFANAQTPMQPEYILLSLMSSIEAFLNPREREKVTKAITEGVAALGGEQGYNYTKKRIEKLYDKRSALSHGDRTEILERDISELRAIAFYIIHQMIQRIDEFITQEQLYEEVKRIRKDIKQRISRNLPSNDS